MSKQVLIGKKRPIGDEEDLPLPLSLKIKKEPKILDSDSDSDSEEVLDINGLRRIKPDPLADNLTEQNYSPSSEKKRNLSPPPVVAVNPPRIPNPYRLNPNLPIIRYANDIMTAIENNQVIVISGRTGCGKTTQVPQLIYRDAERQRKPVKILITQPRRIAAVSIAKRLCHEMGARLGDLVGYHVGMNLYYNNENTKIIIKTTGIFLEELIHEKSNMNNYTHLIIDEVHERDINIDFALVLVKYFLKENKNIKLILMSGTISTVLFANYFSKHSIENVANKSQQKAFDEENEEEKSYTCGGGGFQFDWVVPSISGGKEVEDRDKNKQTPSYLENDAAPVIEIKEQVHKVYEFFLQDILRCLKDTYQKKPELFQGRQFIKFDYHFVFDKKLPCIDENMFTVCLNLIECIHLKTVDPNDKLSTILIFLPGLGEILSFKTFLFDNFSKMNEIEIYTLHSNITDEEQQKVFYNINKRKVILATNIAESSITIDNTSYVIDFCLTKELEFNCKTNHESLELKWASKANCFQRAGRAGRVLQGYVFRLISDNFFHYVLDEYPSPEILRIPLEKVVLKLKVYDCGEPSDILSRAITLPKIRAINTAIANLKSCGALTVNDSSGELTELGKVYTELPIDIKYSRLIMIAYTFGLTEIAIISAAILSQEKKLFKAYGNDRKQLYLNKEKFSYGTNCDIITNFSAYKAWEKEYGFNFEGRGKRFRIRRLGEDIPWCKKNSLDPKILREVQLLASDIKKRLSSLGFYDEKNNNTTGSHITNDVESFAKDPLLVDTFKYILAGAFYGRMFKSNYSDIDKIKKFKEISNKSNIDYSNTLFVRGLPVNFKEENIKKFFSKFGEINYFESQSQEARIGFTEKDYKRAIKLILFLGSNLVLNNQELAIDYENTKIYLRKPEYLYELVHKDIFTFSKVDIEPDSINHVIIEKDSTIVPKIVHICDNYYQRKMKFTARYASRMPIKEMIDLLLILIFAPSAQFFANSERTQYKSFKLKEDAGVEFTFNYLFSSVDIRDINNIRQILNRLVKTQELRQGDVPFLRDKLKDNINKLINKKRLKVIGKDSWNRLLYKFFPQKKKEKEENYQYINQFNEDKKFSFQNLNDFHDSKEIKKTISDRKPNLEHPMGKYSNDFLKPLIPLPIKEDFRLWTEEGLEQIEEERGLYNQMREKLIKRLNERKNMINQKDPEIFCSYCSSFICSIKNIQPCLGSDRYILNIWGKPNVHSPDDKEIMYDKFVMEYNNFISISPEGFFTCFEGKHIIGFIVEGKSFLTKYSPLKVKLPGGDFVPWGEKVFDKNDKDFQSQMKKSLAKREAYLDQNLECELCEKSMSDECQFLDHLRTKEHIRNLKELQEEIF